MDTHSFFRIAGRRFPCVALSHDMSPPSFSNQYFLYLLQSGALTDTCSPQSSGNDIFYRNPYNVNENLFVNVSSPSSSRYTSVEDLKSPQAAAERTKEQYFRELMSTRLGVKRTADIISATERLGPDGRKYYDLEVHAASLPPHFCITSLS